MLKKNEVKAEFYSLVQFRKIAERAKVECSSKTIVT